MKAVTLNETAGWVYEFGKFRVHPTQRVVLSEGKPLSLSPKSFGSSTPTFPCFEVFARFAPGMSGGLVIDEEGSLCGLVCAGTNFG